VSSAYRGDEGNNTPYLRIPTILVAAMMFYSLSLDLFLIMAAASAGSFCAHVHFDKAHHAQDPMATPTDNAQETAGRYIRLRLLYRALLGPTSDDQPSLSWCQDA